MTQTRKNNMHTAGVSSLQCFRIPLTCARSVSCIHSYNTCMLFHLLSIKPRRTTPCVCVPTVQPCNRNELRGGHELEQKSKSKFSVQTWWTAASSNVLEKWWKETLYCMYHWMKRPHSWKKNSLLKLAMHFKLLQVVRIFKMTPPKATRIFSVGYI